jgi:hypothetical protein
MHCLDTTISEGEGGFFFCIPYAASLPEALCSGCYITVQAARGPPLYIIKSTVKAIKEIGQRKPNFKIKKQS